MVEIILFFKIGNIYTNAIYINKRFIPSRPLSPLELIIKALNIKLIDINSNAMINVELLSVSANNLLLLSQIFQQQTDIVWSLSNVVINDRIAIILFYFNVSIYMMLIKQFKQIFNSIFSSLLLFIFYCIVPSVFLSIKWILSCFNFSLLRIDCIWGKILFVIWSKHFSNFSVNMI